MNVSDGIALGLATSFGLLLCGGVAFGAVDPKKEARITQIIRDVRLLPSESAAHPA